MENFRTLLAHTGNAPLLFDGGLGTMLQSRGLPAGEAPERFCLARPDILESIHADYLVAGANIILTATFGGTRYKLPSLEANAEPDVVAFNREMARIARSAVSKASLDHPVFVGGDMGPCGRFVKPLGDLPAMDLYNAYREQVRGLVSGGVDLLVIETQFDLAEARLAVAAVRAECDLPVFVSMTFEGDTTLTGSTPEIFAETMLNLGVDGIGSNCGAGPEQMAPLIDRLLDVVGTDAAVFAEPNAGLPELVDGKSVFRLPPEPFAQKTAQFVTHGVRVVGGCCGTTPDHIAALRKAVNNLDIAQPSKKTPEKGSVVLTTRSRLVRIGGGEPLVLIGERINPTGKKALQAELAAGDFGLAMQFAAEQVALGTPVLDVNVGAPMVDECQLLPDLAERLTGKYTEPLSLDSSNAQAIAAALPCCPGSSLVNSISGESGRMEMLGPLCRQWGAPFILLPLQGKKLPIKASERIAIIENLLTKSEELGLPRRLILVDILALSVASTPEAAKEGLETIRWCTANGLPTGIGLSNISFGLPARELVNATFLAMAMGAGLTSCIANPSAGRVREAQAASDVLLGKDRDAASFVSNYAGWTSASEKSGVSKVAQHAVATTLEEAVIRGDRENVIALVEKELAAGADPFDLVQKRLVPAITEVGKLYERKEYFLPQLLRSAETMQTAFARLKPLLEKTSDAQERPKIVLATVEGDIHDIGKNIVSLLLGNHGFEVIDLGKDVKAEAIVQAAMQHKADLIGLSALMTTTMVRMQETVQLVQEKKLAIPVMVGGAVVTQAFADSIGAKYSSDAVDAVKVAQNLLRETK